MKEFDSEILLNKKCFFSGLYTYFDIMTKGFKGFLMTHETKYHVPKCMSLHKVIPGYSRKKGNRGI